MASSIAGVATRQTPGAARSRWSRGCVMALLLVAAVLAIEGFVLRDPFEPAPRDIDAAVKRAQTLALSESGMRSQALPYRAAYLDPQRWYLPFVKPFVLRTRTGFQSIFPTVAAAVDIPSEWLGGNASIRLLSVLAVLTLVLLMRAFGHLHGDSAFPIAAVLATPMWWYAFGASGPPVSVVLAMAGVLLACAHTRTLEAGLLIGLSSTIRDETLALVPGLLLVLVLRRRSAGPLFRLLIGVAVPIAAVAAVDAWLYGRPPAAHLLHALQGTLFSDLPSGAMPVLRPMSWMERYDTVVRYWLLGRDHWHAITFGGGVVLAVIVRARSGSYWGAVPLLALVLYGAGRDLAATWAAPRRLPGLLQLAPFLVFACLPAPAGDHDSLWRRRSAQIMAAVFIGAAFLTTNTTGGKPLGPRLLLPIWPLLIIAAWLGLRSHLRAWRQGPVHRVLAAGGVMLVAAGLALNVGGLFPAYRHVERDALAATRFVAEVPEDVVVLGSPFAVDPAIAVYERKTVMLASSPADAAEIGQRLGAARVRGLLFVRRDDRDDLRAGFEPYGMVEERRFGRWVIQRWAR